MWHPQTGHVSDPAQSMLLVFEMGNSGAGRGLNVIGFGGCGLLRKWHFAKGSGSSSARGAVLFQFADLRLYRFCDPAESRNDLNSQRLLRRLQI